MDLRERSRSEGLVALNADVLERIVRREPLPAVLEVLTRLVEQYADGMLASVLLTDDARVHLRHGAAPSLPVAYNREIDNLVIGPDVGSCGTAAFLGQPVVVTDVQSDPRWADFRQLAERHGLRACWSTPILAGEDVLGTFALYYRRPRQPEASDLELIELATRLAGIAIERAAAEQAIERQQFLLTEAQRVAMLGSWELDIETGAMGWSDGLFRLLGVEPGSTKPSLDALLAVVSPDDRKAVSEAIDRALIDGHDFWLEHRVVLPDGAPRLIHTRGRIEVDDAGRPSRVLGIEQDVTDLTLALAAARETEMLYQQEHRIAEILQRSLLPSVLPTFPGLTVAARYLPGGEGLAVGGDWYDVFPVTGGGIAFAMGDVVGRGLRAAATMGQLRTALRAYALADPSPARVVGQLSDLVENLGLGEMTTVVYGVLDASTATVRTVCAGHPPPMLIDASGEARFFEPARRPPLGVSVPGAQDDVEVAAPFGPGASLVLYTDGLVERRGASLEDGFAALAELAAGAIEGPEAFCDRILSRLGGDSSADDVALLVLARTST